MNNIERQKRNLFRLIWAVVLTIVAVATLAAMLWFRYAEAKHTQPSGEFVFVGRESMAVRYAVNIENVFYL